MPTLEIHSTDANKSLSYVVTGTGGIAKRNSSDHENPTEANDNVHRLPGSMYVIIGHTNDNNADSYTLNQQPDGFRKYDGDSGYEIRYGGNDITDSIGDVPTDAGQFGPLDPEGLKKWHMSKFPEISEGTLTPDSPSSWGSHYLDMTEAHSYVDFSSYQHPSINTGRSAGFWVNLHQAGTEDHEYGPGISAGYNDSSGNHYSDFLTFRNDDGTAPQTEGTCNVNISGDKSGDYCSSEAFSVDLSNEDWHHVVMVHHSDGTMTWYVDGSEIPVRDASSTTGAWRLDFFGYGYPDSTNMGSGGKDVDQLALWADDELTSDEVTEWYENGTLPDNVSHLWEFDDKYSKDIAVDSVGYIDDYDGMIRNCSYGSGGPAAESKPEPGKDPDPEPDGMELSGPLEIAGTSDTPSMEYTFEVQGEVTGGDTLESTDTITSGEPTVVSGEVDSLGNDVYEINGYIVSWEAARTSDGSTVDSSNYDLLYDGSSVELWELLGNEPPDDGGDGGGGEEPEPDGMELNGPLKLTGTSDTPSMEYAFEVQGEVTGGETLENDDNITPGEPTVVNGYLANLGNDVYEINGYIVSWEAARTSNGNHVPRGSYDLSYDGDAVELWELLGEEEPPEANPDAMELNSWEDTPIEITSNSATSTTIDYSIVVTGEAAWVQGERGDNDSVDYGPPGRINGTLTQSESDRYFVKGQMAEFEAVDANTGSPMDPIQYDIYYNGSQVEVWELLGEEDPNPDSGDGGSGGDGGDDGSYDGMGLVWEEGPMTLSSTSRTPPIEYEIVTTGGITAVEGTTESADSISGIEPATITGTFGPAGSDSFWIDGYIKEWNFVHADTGAEVDPTRYDVYWGGDSRSDIIEVWRLLGEEEPEYLDESAQNLGGGQYYSRKVTESDADYVADSLAEVRDALSNYASSGDIVFIPGHVEMYSPSINERIHIPRGVTLASDRGVNGSPGALIHTDVSYMWDGDGLVRAEGDNARITGIRVRGPLTGVRWHYHTYDYEQSGVRAAGSNVEIDNCEVYRWSTCIRAGNDSHVHHNHVHHANMEGLGYGVYGGTGVIIEYNHFEHWRHAVASGGNAGFEVRHNLFDGPQLAHCIDQHTPGGIYTHVHHNTSTPTSVEQSSKDPVFVCLRGNDVNDAEIHHNWVQGNTKMPDHSDDAAGDGAAEEGGWTDEFISQAQAYSWGDITYWSNHLGQSNPQDPNIGAPRE